MPSTTHQHHDLFGSPFSFDAKSVVPYQRTDRRRIFVPKMPHSQDKSFFLQLLLRNVQFRWKTGRKMEHLC